jgi:hypothetical protein
MNLYFHYVPMSPVLWSLFLGLFGGATIIVAVIYFKLKKKHKDKYKY